MENKMTYAQKELKRIHELSEAGLLNRVNFQDMDALQRHIFQKGNEKSQAERLKFVRGDL